MKNSFKGECQTSTNRLSPFSCNFDQARNQENILVLYSTFFFDGFKKNIDWKYKKKCNANAGRVTLEEVAFSFIGLLLRNKYDSDGFIKNGL